MFRFQSPLWILLLLVIPILFWLNKKIKYGSFVFSDISFIKKSASSTKYKTKKLILRTFALIFFIIAMMRPQSVDKTEEILTKGIDIILTIDISGSMQSKDFAPNNRLDASKVVVSDFINGRKNDRIGMVIFAKYSFTQCPLTMDYGILLKLLREIKIGQIEDGTAIGMAIATSVKRLKDSDAKSKVIILLTDGVNNSGKIDPVTSAKVAQSLGIKVYAVAVGRQGRVPFPMKHPVFGEQDVLVETKIDEKLLQEIADMTGGLYFRAENERMLKDIYKQIDALEKTKIKTKEYFSFKEYFYYFVWIGLFFVFLEFFIFHIKYPRFP